MNHHKSTTDDQRISVDRVATTAMCNVFESSEQGRIADLISGCRNAAITATLDAKPELAAVFIHLGAELIATAGEEVVIEAAITNPSKAIALTSALA